MFIMVIYIKFKVPFSQVTLWHLDLFDGGTQRVLTRTHYVAMIWLIKIIMGYDIADKFVLWDFDTEKMNFRFQKLEQVNNPKSYWTTSFLCYNFITFINFNLSLVSAS